MDSSKRFLITGGSGYLGTALVDLLYGERFYKLTVVARNEGQLIKLQQKYPLIDIVTGDISDPFIAEKACRDVRGIFHLAAFKHVGLAETNVRECVDSNITGTINLLEETRRRRMDFIIGISTDKAARVNGVYGATKLLQEKLFTEYETVNKKTKYRTVRYGNVLYSTGSVLCKWKDLLKAGRQLIVTDMDATRFYWTVDEAIDLIFDTLEGAKDSTPQSVPMKAIRVGDLLEAMADKYANGTYTTKLIGLQPGENKHEIITADGKTSREAERYTKEEIMELI